jgi:hypothetical protein
VKTPGAIRAASEATCVTRLSDSAEYRWDMSTALEDVTREAIQLPRHQRLALARFLIELDAASDNDAVEAAWDAEIRERVLAVEQGRAEGIPYEKVLARVDQRLAP